MSETFKDMDGFWWAVVDGRLVVVECENGFWWYKGRVVYLEKLGLKIEPPDLPVN